MGSIQEDEWASLQLRIRSVLRCGSGGSLESYRVERLAQVLVMPAFASWTSSEIFLVSSGESDESDAQVDFVATRLTWDQRADLERLTDSPGRSLVEEPSLSRLQAPIPHEVARKLASDVAGLHLTLAPGEASGGLDGTSYVLVLGEYPAEVLLTWHNRPPDNWVDAGRLAAAVVEMVDAVVK